MWDDTYYEMLKRINDDHSRKVRVIQKDDDRTLSGKEKEISRLKEERDKAIGEVNSSYEKEYLKRKNTLDGKLNSSKVDPGDVAKKVLNDRLTKDINFGRLSGDPGLDDNSRFAVLLNTVEKHHRERMDFEKAKVISRRSPDYFVSEIQRLYNEKNSEGLSMLRDAIELMDNDVERVRLLGSVGPMIDRLKDEALTPSQREARDELTRLEKGKSFWDYTKENILSRDAWADARPRENAPVTEVIPYRAPTQQSSGGQSSE